MELRTRRFLIRDFREADREAFVTYQMDPRYRALYDLDDDDGRAHRLFDCFMSWQNQDPRRDIQVGIFAADTERLRGCCGLRMSEAPERAAVLGIELIPDDWGAYRLAVDVAGALLEYAFSVLDLDLVVGRTASGNRRIERLARWFGATSAAYRDGPDWMALRGCFEVDWKLDRDTWYASRSKDRGRGNYRLRKL